MSEQDTTTVTDANDAPDFEETSENVIPEEALEDVEDAVEEKPVGDSSDAEQQEEHSELDMLRAESQKNLDGWQRTLAEFQNYKRRVEREQASLRQQAALDALSQVLPIVDDFDRAMANLPEDLQTHAWINGISMMPGKFQKLLDDHDIEVVDPTGEVFDPMRHQAIGAEDSDEYESGHVIETLQKGYASGDIILRPALVRVAN